MNKSHLKMEVIFLCFIIITLSFSAFIKAKETRDTPQLTSLEAAALAYQAAKKWDCEAVLWYMNPHGRKLDYHWAENDLSWEWDIIFVRPQDDKRFNIRIVNSKIISLQEEKHVKRISPILSSFPKNKPGISMQEAAQVAFTAGAPSWERTSSVYIIDNTVSTYRGKPVWVFLFASQSAAYTIDGLTGELLSIQYFDPNTGKNIEPKEIKYELVSDIVDRIKEENYIYEFFETVDREDFEQVFSMMDENLIGNVNMKEMWKANFSSLDKIKMVSLYPEEEQKWHNHQPLYEVSIYVKSKPGFPYYGWDEGRNTRWITVTTEEDRRKIVSIATSP